MASIQNAGAEKVSEPVTEPTVSVDLSKIQFRSMPVSEARSRMVRSLASRGLSSPRRLARSETGVQAAGASEFTLDGEQPPSEQERASYDAMVGALSGSPLLEQDTLNGQIVSSIDSEGLSQAISHGVSDVDPSAFNAGDEEQMLKLQDSLQASLDGYSEVLADQARSVAEQRLDSLNEAAEDAVNTAVIDRSDAEALTSYMETSYREKAAASRSLNDSTTVVGTKDLLLQGIKDSAQPGDILYVTSPGLLSQTITGHMAIFEQDSTSNKGKWFTAFWDNGDINTARSDYFYHDSQVINPEFTAQKMLRVNSSKAAWERQNALQEAYEKYNGKGYNIPLLKRATYSLTWDHGLSEHGWHYCSQLAWLVWDKLGTDIDGTWWSTSFTVKDVVTTVVPVTIVIGWWSMTFYVTVTYIIISLITSDIVYPWDVVIDSDTTEYLRYGPRVPNYGVQ